jgi:hypothetical protein
MTDHICQHAEEWGTVRQQIKGLEKCADTLKGRMDKADDRMDKIELAQVTKQDFNEFKKGIQVVGVWTVIGIFVGQVTIGWLTKIGVIQ